MHGARISLLILEQKITVLSLLMYIHIYNICRWRVQGCHSVGFGSAVHILRGQYCLDYCLWLVEVREGGGLKLEAQPELWTKPTMP